MVVVQSWALGWQLGDLGHHPLTSSADGNPSVGLDVIALLSLTPLRAESLCFQALTSATALPMSGSKHWGVKCPCATYMGTTTTDRVRQEGKGADTKQQVYSRHLQRPLCIRCVKRSLIHSYSKGRTGERESSSSIYWFTPERLPELAQAGSQELNVASHTGGTGSSPQCPPAASHER